MNIVFPGFEILQIPDYKFATRLTERIGRVCTATVDKMTGDSAVPFIERVMAQDHMGLLEHCVVTVEFVHTRNVTHQLVRHRLASYAQESQRYVNYKKKGMSFIQPYWYDEDFDPYAYADNAGQYEKWRDQMAKAEAAYIAAVTSGLTPEAARGVLPPDIKTVIVVTANIREWRVIFKQRLLGTTGRPHPDMVRILAPLLVKFKEELSVFFGDIVYETH